MYFLESGYINYDTFVVTDITKRTNIVRNLLSDEDFYFKYELNSGDTPETVAYGFYGNAQYHWILFLINEIYDPLYEWYMTYNEVVAYAKLKYGDPDYTYVQYYSLDGVKYKTDPGGASVAVTNLEYEIAENDKKRTIKVVYPEYVPAIIREYKELI